MVLLRVLSLLLALGLSAPAFAAVTEAYESPLVAGPNNSTDYTEKQCVRDGSGNPLTDFGCVANDGTLCSDVTDAICDVQRVPAGRCSAGSSNSCIFPGGAGTCVADPNTTYDDTDIGCLPDDTADHTATAGTFVAEVCSQGANSLCDMSTNVLACRCQGDDPSDPNHWEGVVCGGDDQARCSDGDPQRGVASFGGSLCTSIDIVGLTGGRCADSNRFPGLPGSPAYGVESVGKLGTPQRRPGTSLSAPTTPIRQLRTTGTWVFDEYDDPNIAFAEWNIRKFRMLGNSFFADILWISAQTNSANLNNSIVTHMCDPPDPWQSNLPLTGACTANPGTECQRDSDCPAADTCNPASKVYCWQSGRDAEGLIFTRDLSDSELADANMTGICPPDCQLDNDFTTFNFEAIIAAGDLVTNKDPRAGVQLALDNLSGPRAGKGDMIYVFPITSMTWLKPDNRCYMGGDPDVVDATCGSVSPGLCGSTTVPCSVTADCQATIGRCDGSDVPCNPGASGECGGTADCLVCGGTWNGTYGSNPGGYTDSVNGNANAFHIGYLDPTGKLPLHTAGNTALTRVGPTSDINTDVRVPIYGVFTSGKSGVEFRDNTCSPSTKDHCALGEVSSGGGTGIGSGGSFGIGTTVTYDPLGGGYTATSTWAADNPGVETSGENTFLRIFDRAAGDDGVPACLGDNLPIGGLDVPCDSQLGNPSVPGSTGSDDVPLAGDFSTAQNGSDMRVASFARFKMVDPTRDTPIFNAVSSIGGRDESIFGIPKNLDFINKTNSTWCPLTDPNQIGGDCDRSAESFCSEHGGDTNNNQICDDLEGGCPDADADGVCDGVDNCPQVANPGQTTNSQGATQTVKPDGIACACLCGDVNRDCVINSADKLEMVLAAGFAPPALLWDPVYCDVNRDGLCNSGDALEIVLWSGFAPPALNIVFGPPHGAPGSGVVCF